MINNYKSYWIAAVNTPDPPVTVTPTVQILISAYYISAHKCYIKEFNRYNPGCLLSKKILVKFSY